MTASKSFFYGDVVVVDLTMRVEDTLTNPTLVTFYILTPSGSISSPTTIDRAGTGVFGFEYEPLEEGWFRWRGEGTAPAVFAREGTFYVQGKTLELESQPET